MPLNKTDDFDSVTEDIRKKAEGAGLSTIWRSFSDDKKAGWIRPLMDVGHSNKTAAATLGITLGQVAGIRNKKSIPSRNPPRGGRAKRIVVKFPGKSS